MRIVCSARAHIGADGSREYVDATHMMVAPDGQDGMQACDEHAQPLKDRGWAATPVTPEYADNLAGALSTLASRPLASTPDVWGGGR